MRKSLSLKTEDVGPICQYVPNKKGLLIYSHLREKIIFFFSYPHGKHYKNLYSGIQSVKEDFCFKATSIS